MTKFLWTIPIIVLFIACKPDQLSKGIEESKSSKLGIENYEDILRHPISLQNTIDSSQLAIISFDKTISEFDTINVGAKTQHVFEYKNIGSNALYILDTKVSCGCTVVEYDENALLPNDTNKIVVEFDSQGKLGLQEKNIIVISNSYPNETVLKIRGYIK